VLNNSMPSPSPSAMIQEGEDTYDDTFPRFPRLTSTRSNAVRAESAGHAP
jgi:hypothetical protein